jgi:hypothetical protein
MWSWSGFCCAVANMEADTKRHTKGALSTFRMFNKYQKGPARSIVHFEGGQSYSFVCFP